MRALVCAVFPRALSGTFPPGRKTPPDSARMGNSFDALAVVQNLTEEEILASPSDERQTQNY